MISPKDMQDKIEQVTQAWGDLAPDKSFAGFTLAEFKAKVQPSLLARAELETLDNQVSDAQTRRAASDDVSLKTIQLVVNAIKGDPTEGEDSALYQECGYVRKSERKSGLSRKNTAKTAAPLREQAKLAA